jgi:hypothetical protein
VVVVVVVSAVVEEGAVDESVGSSVDDGVSSRTCDVGGAASIDVSSRSMNMTAATERAATVMTMSVVAERRSML